MGSAAIFNAPNELCISPSNLLDELESAGLITHKFSLKQIQDSSSRIITDSRQIAPGCIFIAIRGSHHNGHDHIFAAIEQGACLIVCEDRPQKNLDKDASLVVVSSSRAAWALACSAATGFPDRDMVMFGITGTNGKTSTVWMIKALLTAQGIKAATIGTLGFYVGENEHYETIHTTPDPDVLYPMLRHASDSGCRAVAMEVSSHALAQNKLTPVRFDVAAFTSFSQDHLDLHQTMGAYLDAKLTLFRTLLKVEGTAVIHGEVWPLIKSSLNLKKSPFLYGQRKMRQGEDTPLPAQYSCIIRALPQGQTLVDILRPDGKKPLCRFNIPFVGAIFGENFTCAVLSTLHASALSYELPQPSILAHQLSAVPGRMQGVATLKPWRPLVFVDYAHTPDALEKSLLVARSITPGRLFVVFGCGGDRDKTKRPLMGSISQRLADQIILTSDNPRSEEPKKIVDDIIQGISTTNVKVLMDRRKALEFAIRTASGGDTVLIAGKGHENYQITGDQVLPFSDSEVAHSILDRKISWCVVGAGVSGLAAARYLARLGDLVRISESSSLSPNILQELNSLGISARDGGHLISHLDDVDGLILSPGVGGLHPLVVEGRKRGLKILSEIDLGLQGFSGRTIAVTGTNGKSTTVALTDHVLKCCGVDSRACGNIGIPPTGLNLKDLPADSAAVVELSSYQLESSHTIRSNVAMITSFSFDHIARHGSMNSYFEAKWKIVKGLESEDILLLRGHVFAFAQSHGFHFPKCRVLVIHDSLGEFEGALVHGSAEHYWIDNAHLRNAKGIICDLSLLNLVGTHNQINAAFSLLCAVHVTGRDIRSLEDFLASFSGLPHRCQFIGKTSLGLPIINDSKSTNSESTLIALTAMKEPCLLLVGGQGKGEDYSSLLAARDKIKLVLAFGASRQDFSRDLGRSLPVEEFITMKEAVQRAMMEASIGPYSILFSPACASFDEFKNFEHRGEVFAHEVTRFLSAYLNT